MNGPNGSTPQSETEEREVEGGPSAVLTPTHLLPLDRAELAEAKALVDRAAAELGRVQVEAANVQMRRQLCEGEHARAMAVLQERRQKLIAAYGLSERDAIDLVSGAIQRVPPPAEAHN